jgi:hypothetical protein
MPAEAFSKKYVHLNHMFKIYRPMKIAQTRTPHAPFLRLMVLVSALCLIHCKNETSSTTTARDSVEQEPSTTIDAVPAGTYYYANKTASPLAAEHYNYNFIRCTVAADGKVIGVFYAAPYGTDGASGSFKGALAADRHTLNVERSYMAEGERYKDSINFKLLPEAIGLGYDTPKGSVASLPKVSAEAYDRLFKAYQSQILGALINTTDRTRLYGLSSLIEDMKYSKADLDQLRFMEYQLDLDNDFSTREFLLYIIDPMLCGSGGCNLYILSATEEVLSKLTVTRPPIYVDLLAYDESQARKGQLKTLYVQSKGMRRVAPVNGSYPKNPSVLNTIKLEDLQAFPERYQLIMDYLE